MTRFTKIFVMFAVIQWPGLIVCTPLFQGISISKNFEIALKRLQIKPLTYIKEKWGPFGTFGRRHSITKRQTALDIIAQSEPILNQGISSIGSRVATLTPPPAPLSPILPPGMNTAISVPPAWGLNNDGTGLTDRSPAPVYEINPSEPPPVPMNVPFAPINTAPVSPTISNEIIGSTTRTGLPPRFVPVAPINSSPARTVASPQWISGFNTAGQIGPAPLFANDPFRVNLLTPPTPTPPTVQTQAPPEATSRRGIFARLFGDFFLALLSRFLNNARASINPVPIPSAPVQ